jgi:hypothetical protein
LSLLGHYDAATSRVRKPSEHPSRFALIVGSSGGRAILRRARRRAVDRVT